jgi:ATP-dependent exoDNAse (exonuclease V) alpha subunit
VLRWPSTSSMAVPGGLFVSSGREADFTVGDRVQITATDKRAGLCNGQFGTIAEIDAEERRITAVLDDGRTVSWCAAEFTGFRHGYAGTVYKGQGKTESETYLLRSRHWRAASSYVALTRQTHRISVFAARETAGDTETLARQMAQPDERRASVAYADAAELPEVLRQKAILDAAQIGRLRVRANQAIRTLADRLHRITTKTLSASAPRVVSPVVV